MCPGSDTVVTPFNPTVLAVLATDASPDGIAAILSHKIGGTEKPIVYTSRLLNNAEKNYSQLDREALAIVFGVTWFHEYPYGLHFTLVIDNQPLTHIFASNKPLPKFLSARLLQYASFLHGNLTTR